MIELEKLSSEINICAKCELCKTRTNSVPGFGNPRADVFFVGEAPGKNEDQKGEPFVGAAGKMLDKLLESIEMRREDVYITNIVKCRPPENRDPSITEKKICSEYLSRQIKIINPEIVVTLGRHAMNFFMPLAKISQEHGKVTKIEDRFFLPLYHPASALYNGGLRDTLFDDFKIIPSLISKIEKE